MKKLIVIFFAIALCLTPSVVLGENGEFDDEEFEEEGFEDEGGDVYYPEPVVEILKSCSCTQAVSIKVACDDSPNSYAVESGSARCDYNWNLTPCACVDCAAECQNAGYGTPEEPEPDPEPDPEPQPSANEGGECSAFPVLENFTASGESTCSAEKVYIKLIPNGDPGFYLNVQIEVKDGQDELSAWCTGDEGLCKAVGNGQTCSGTNYSGANAWCYKAE